MRISVEQISQVSSCMITSFIMLKWSMHIDLYSANNDLIQAVQDLLALLDEDGVSAQASAETGEVLSQVSADTFDAFLQAIQHWNAQRPGRHAKPDEILIREKPETDVSITITVHPPQAAASAS